MYMILPVTAAVFLTNKQSRCL